MEISTKQKVQRWIIAVCLLFILFFGSQVPSPSVKMILVGVPGLIAVVLEILVLGQKTQKKYKWQDIVLILLTIMSITVILMTK